MDNAKRTRRFRVIRYAGLAGAVLLAVAAWHGGALPAMHVRVTPASVWRGPDGPLILGTWFAGTALMTGAWWAARDGVPSARWAYVTIGLWLLPLLVVPPLGSRDVYAYACQGAVMAAGHNPYQEGVSALPCPWLHSVSPIWQGTPAPYGPLGVLVAGWVVAAAGTLTGSIIAFRLVALVGLATSAVSLPVLARRCGIPTGRALWLALACPLVGLHFAAGAHNDALMIGLMLAGLAVVAARPGRPWPLLTGGLLLGLAAAIKAVAAVVVPFAALAAVAGVGVAVAYPLRQLLRDGGLVVGGTLVGAVGVTAASGLGMGWVGGLSHSGDSVQWTSPSTAVGLTVGYLERPFGGHWSALPLTRGLALVILAVVLVYLWWRARRGQPMYHAGLALAATLALGPVFHPWYATWPLTVLAATTPRTGWIAGICAAASFLVLPDGTGLARFSKAPGSIGMTVLTVVVAVLLVRRLRAQRSAPDEPSPPADRQGSVAGRRDSLTSPARPE
jgi:alpha-1,6-mannosyltransferase